MLERLAVVLFPRPLCERCDKEIYRSREKLWVVVGAGELRETVCVRCAADASARGELVESPAPPWLPHF
jgi:hypothetical protein